MLEVLEGFLLLSSKENGTFDSVVSVGLAELADSVLLGLANAAPCAFQELGLLEKRAL